nr:hypothetical protein [Tanacetum cinerariifolium]
LLRDAGCLPEHCGLYAGVQSLLHPGAGLAARAARRRLAVAAAAGRRVHGVRFFDFGRADEAHFGLRRQPHHQSGAGVWHCAGANYVHAGRVRL